MNHDAAQLDTNGTAVTDLTLVHATRSGDVSAFEELVRRYDRRLFRIGQHMVHNREDAEDVVQEAFLKAYQHLDQFREDAKFSTWLIRIAMNQSLMWLRKQRTVREVSIDNDFQLEDGDLPMDVPDWAPNPEQLYRAAELREILRNTLQELSPSLRIVFVLRDIEEFTLEQTAEVLQLSVAAVKARSWRVRLQVRKRLSDYFNQTQEPLCLESGSTSV
jgi:RNA polymerase sigma-70 factor, ECF subfamily